MKKIAVITPGGDAPGMNSAVRAVVREGLIRGHEVYGVYHGYRGLIDGNIERFNLRSVSGIINRGGTMLGTRRCPDMKTKEGQGRALANLAGHGIEGLVVIGGDGSMQGGAVLSRAGIKVIGIPASIDNDIFGTDETIGFDTAVNTSVEAIDKIRDTAASHDRIFIVEVMGREHGFLALSVGIAAGAEFILAPEAPLTVASLSAELNTERYCNKTSVIIVFAEGAGNPFTLAEQLRASVPVEIRVSSLGYIQRGGSPSARSRILACRFGAHAVELLSENRTNEVVVLQGDAVTSIPIETCVNGVKQLDDKLYKLAGRLSQ
ncbi:MAG: ATP-dependent 6-phosphofructokinase [Elusimicrobia bacterium RIFOXYA2_FULL_50_26]|nr:MAG: ATP-dependent 6-phosphofructokinase [Elusimicrobia bacterium RIFOXYA2_FULL_50_26]